MDRPGSPFYARFCTCKFATHEIFSPWFSESVSFYRFKVVIKYLPKIMSENPINTRKRLTLKDQLLKRDTFNEAMQALNVVGTFLKKMVVSCRQKMLWS